MSLEEENGPDLRSSAPFSPSPLTPSNQSHFSSSPSSNHWLRSPNQPSPNPQFPTFSGTHEIDFRLHEIRGGKKERIRRGKKEQTCKLCVSSSSITLARMPHISHPTFPSTTKLSPQPHRTLANSFPVISSS